ncbi:ATP-binding cassette domain-containing protein [Gorillibacterium timonense]|uniref:ATP-binding cassette domain-containing protein n=1 Tax=Gorillibacterium timonense TaxID=1689269 RepID=UPI00071CADB2|nr:ATP-binding cassette domain-containing protein [Gorillibacterium timonense]
MIESVTIRGGRFKNGAPEAVEITLVPGDITAIVGATGSGKSRLLADIEYLAQVDTPSGRQILINGDVPDSKTRFSRGSKLIAQLSQNMNFVMDATVEEFIVMHAECREDGKGEGDASDRNELIHQVVSSANRLTGEPLSPSSPLTALSGGQSRALMIADTALLSDSPIVLIDELENAGIYRDEALRMLVRVGKIVLMATHDPLLALAAHRRITLSGGGIVQVLTTSDEEKRLLSRLKQADTALLAIRETLRRGERLSENSSLFLLAHE